MTATVLAVLLGIALAGVVYVWRRSTREPEVVDVIAEPVKERAEAEAALEDVKAEAVVFHAELKSVLDIEDDRERLQRLADLAEKGGRR